MIKEIRLTNFKCFENETIFPLAQINLLTGINGKGKSSFLQSMLLIKQSIEQNQRANYLLLNGNCVHLGTRADVKNVHSLVDEPICFEFLYETTKEETRALQTPRNLLNSAIPAIENFTQRYSYYFTHPYYLKASDEKILIDKCNTIVSGNGILKEQKISLSRNFSLSRNWYHVTTTDEGTNEGINNLHHFSNFRPTTGGNQGIFNHSFTFIKYRFTFISADRIGPKDFYPKSNNHDDVAKNGENAVNILAKKQDSLVNDALYRGNNAQTLLDQTGEWLSYIFDTPNISIELDQTNPFFISLRFNINYASFLPSNVGFGYSYVLPVIVAALLAEQSRQSLIIENPEAHLHPRAQSRLTEFLAIVASCGVQIFIESHSEHILNGLRIATLKPEINIKNTDVSVLYFDNRVTQPIQIAIEPDGGINTWPDGFFDQNDKDYKILFGL
jgi:predicted ATPase